MQSYIKQALYSAALEACLACRPTCDEQAAFTVEVEQSLPALTLPVLDHVGLIQDQVLPLLPPEHLGILCSMHNMNQHISSGSACTST